MSRLGIQPKYEDLVRYGRFINDWYVGNHYDWTDEFKEALTRFNSVSELLAYVHENGQPFTDKFGYHYLILWGVRFMDGGNRIGGVHVIEGSRSYIPALIFNHETMDWDDFRN